MAKNYAVMFGQTLIQGLSPTFILFESIPGGGATTPPGITQLPTNSGIYYFTAEPLPNSSIAFVIDGATTQLSTLSRYVYGTLDPIQAVDELVVQLGSSLQALGSSLSIGNSNLSSLIGTTADSYGTLTADPTTVFGYLKRALEFNEGDSQFVKNSGIWNIYSRGTSLGTATQLTQKLLADNGSIVSKQ